MADDGSKEGATWPMPKFSFKVNWGSQQDIAFQEVSGMDKEVQIIEYRACNGKLYNTIKMPRHCQVWQCHHEARHLCEG